MQLWPEEKVKEILFTTYVIFSQLNVSPAYNLKSFLFRGFGAVNQIFNIYERIRNWKGWDRMRAKMVDCQSEKPVSCWYYSKYLLQGAWFLSILSFFFHTQFFQGRENCENGCSWYWGVHVCLCVVSVL